MLKRILAAAALIALAAGGAAAQTPFEEIHGDLIRKMEVRRVRADAMGGPVAMPDPTPNQLLYDVLHYELDIAFRHATEEVQGSVTMLIESLIDSLHSIDIDADNVLTVSSVIEVGGAVLSHSHLSDILTVTLAAGLAAGEQIEIRIEYSGLPTTATDTGLFFRNYSGTEVIYSLSEPWGARTWWPCKDYPDDKATFDIYLSVPAGLFATSNGTYLGENDETFWSAPYKRYHWHEAYPMPTYLASIAASEYVLLEDSYVYAIGETLDVTHYVYPDREAAAAEDFNVAVPMLEFYSLTFGTYPFTGEKYGVALCNIGGGMEHQTLTSYGYWLVTGDHRYDYIYAHELAHQWFGDLITCKDWTHIWLNEGFASYAEALWFEHLEGPVKLQTYMESKDRPSYWSGPIMRDANNNDPWYYFNQVVYDKAAWVLHMLRHIVGDATFRTILQSYVADTRFRYSVAETDDFISVCEDSYGAPLDWFFDPWLTRTDRLAYDWNWISYEQAGVYYLTVMVDQVQQDLYTMPVDFRIVTGAGQIDTTFWVDERHEEYQLVLADSTLSVELDPDHWILCTENRISTGAEATPRTAFLDQNYPNPFNPITTIRFGISEPGRVALQIFDVRGALVTTINDRHFERGTYEAQWNGVSARGEPVTSGIYFYRLRTAAGVISRKMLLLR